MKKSARYREQDYAFGQLMLTLRTTIGLTQARLADVLNVSRHAVAEWEAGGNYPTVEHLKHLIEPREARRPRPAGGRPRCRACLAPGRAGARRRRAVIRGTGSSGERG